VIIWLLALMLAQVQEQQLLAVQMEEELRKPQELVLQQPCNGLLHDSALGTIDRHPFCLHKLLLL
jgi:hypothetical protein